MSKVKLFLLTLPILVSFFISPANGQDNDYVIQSGAAPTMTNAPIFLAKELGFFEEQGLNVEVTTHKGAGASQTMLLATGKLDTGGGGFSTGLWRAINNGEGIKLVACKSHFTDSEGTWALLVRKDLVDSGRYKTLSDLKGFTMTLPALQGSGPEGIHDAFLKAGGLTYDDVKVIKMRYSDVNIAFEKKAIDATAQNEPYVTKSVLDGTAVVVKKGYEVLPNYQGAAIFYSPLFIKNHRDLAEKWMIAYLKGVRAYRDAFFKGINKNEVIQMLKKYIHIEDDRIWEQAAPAVINPNGYLNLESLKQNLDWYMEKGYINKRPNLDEAVDHSFVDKAIEKIGTYEE